MLVFVHEIGACTRGILVFYRSFNITVKEIVVVRPEHTINQNRDGAALSTLAVERGD